LAHQEFFGRFRSMKHEFTAVFGKEAAKSFEALWRIRIDVNHAVDSMLRHPDMSDSRDQENRKLWESWYRTAFRNPIKEQDEIEKRVFVESSG